MCIVTPKAELDSFIDKYTPEMARAMRRALTQMRKTCPGALELVYDNYNALAVGFATGERVADVLFSIVAYPKWVSIFFFRTLPLKDPNKRLAGGGKTTKHVVLDAELLLADPDVAALIDQALAKAGDPFAGGMRGRIVVKSISTKQRPRRPGH
jgi:hypothetical protein